MAEPTTFRKSRAQYLINCFENGLAINHDPEQPDWTRDEIIQLAGAVFAVLYNMNPLEPCNRHSEERPRELVEADNVTLCNEIFGAIEFAGFLTSFVRLGEYDECYDDVVKFVSTWEYEGIIKRYNMPLSGWRRRERDKSTDTH
jgi:hypothetical protein